jgi:two-component system, NtrC family, response regulator
MILIVDDDIAVQTSLSLLFKQAGLASVCASNPAEGLKLLEQNKPEVIILDLNYSNDTSGKEGLEFLTDIKKIMPSVPVILITAWASIALAVKGMKKGAFDFVSKPWDNDDLLRTISMAIELNKKTQGKHAQKRAQLDKKFDFTEIIGESLHMISVLETIGRVCKTDAQVLILGDSGTGKELIAEAIHNNSNRKDAPFVKVNLGGISSGLFESEMFGHRKGAFTDAYNDRKGRFEMANKGTIFLDEIGDLDFNSQVKLLRVLQDKTYQVLGESHSRRIDVRVICATNRNLNEMVKKGTFREDLLYRINLITIELPSLQDRKDDIPLIVKYFLKNLMSIYNTSEIVVENDTLKWLQNNTYPGNIRELKNLVERTWLLTGKNELTITDFEKALEQSMGVIKTNDFLAPGKMTLEEMEKEVIIRTMEKFRNNFSKVAKSLGLSRGALYRRLEKFNIPFNREQDNG